MEKYIVLFLFLGFFSCKNAEKEKAEVSEVSVPTYEKLQSLDWILGQWTNINEETQSFETWEQLNDSTLVAMSVTVKEKDTVFAERMKLYEELGTVKLYVETVGENPNPVVFTLNEAEGHAFTFENPKNDFPSQIVYSIPSENKIHAWVSGTVDGEPQKIDFYFNRGE